MAIKRPVYTMTRTCSRYGTRCIKCKGRIRIGRKFVIDAVDSNKVFHEGCYDSQEGSKTRRAK